MAKTKFKSFRLPEELLERLEVRAEEDNTTSSMIIVRAVTQFLDGPNGPKEYSVISPELVEFGKELTLGLVADIRESVKLAIFSKWTPASTTVEHPEKTEAVTVYKDQEIEVEPTQGVIGLARCFTTIAEEVPIEEVKEKIKVPRGTCSECFAKNGQHQKFCTKRKK
jgi:hypothetical protein